MKKVLELSGQPDMLNAQDRLNGWRDALASAGAAAACQLAHASA